MLIIEFFVICFNFRVIFLLIILEWVGVIFFVFEIVEEFLYINNVNRINLVMGFFLKIVFFKIEWVGLDVEGFNMFFFGLFVFFII